MTYELKPEQKERASVVKTDRWEESCRQMLQLVQGPSDENDLIVFEEQVERQWLKSSFQRGSGPE